MKTLPLLRPSVAAATLVLALGLVDRRVQAGERPSTPPTIPTEAAGPEAPVPFDLEIVDGMLIPHGGKGAKGPATLGRVVDELRNQYPKANIVLAPGLATAPVSDLKLHAGGLPDGLEAIRVASGDKFVWVGPPGANPGVPAIDPTTGLALTHFPDLSTGLYTLREAPDENARMVEVFNVGPYLEYLERHYQKDPKRSQNSLEVRSSIDELQEMIGDTLTMLKTASGVPTERPRFRFHPGANLLVVIGTRDAVEVARKVVSALPGQASSWQSAQQAYSELIREMSQRAAEPRPPGSPAAPAPPATPAPPGSPVPPGAPAPPH